jgi:hypothetical protein
VKEYIYLAPDAALLFVLMRMAGVKLAGERPAFFIFLCAWWAFSITSLLMAQRWAPGSPLYVKWFAYLTLATWACGVWPLVRAAERIPLPSYRCMLIFIAIGLAAFAAERIFARAGHSVSVSTQVASCWIAVVVGAVFLCAAWKAEQPDVTLWTGAGAYFVIYGGGILLAGQWRGGRALFPIVAAAGALAWAALAYYVGPHPDHLFNVDKLALLPIARRAYGIARLRLG